MVLKGDAALMSRNWCFRVSNPDAPLYPDIDWMDVRYCVYQEEIGADGENTHHFQGYVQFNISKRMTQLKKYEGLEGAWLQIQKGTNEQARAYCMKDDETTIKGTRYECGVFCAGQGARQDVIALRQAIKDKKTKKEIYDNDDTILPAIRYQRGMEDMIRTYTQPDKRRFKTHVTVMVGDTGVGKTRRAYAIDENLFMKPHTKWWDDYKYQPTVLFDEFYGWYPYHMLLTVCDRYDCPVEVKNGYMQIAPTTLIITSNRHVMDWYNKETIPNIAPLLRRIDKYVWIKKNGDEKIYEGSDMDDGLPTWYRAFQFDCLPRNYVE